MTPPRQPFRERSNQHKFSSLSHFSVLDMAIDPSTSSQAVPGSSPPPMLDTSSSYDGFAPLTSEVSELHSDSPVASASQIAQLQRQLQQQHQRQQLLGQIISTSRDGSELNHVYHLAVDGLVQTLQASRGLLLLFKYADPRHRSSTVGNIAKAKALIMSESWGSNWTEASTDQTIPESTAPNQPDAKQDSPFWASECSLCQAILLGQPELVVSGDTFDTLTASSAASVQNQAQSHPLFQLEHLPAVLMLPLENQGTILGALVLQQHQPRTWATDEVNFVRLIAAQISTTIIQTRSFQQVQAVVHERTAQLQRSLEVQAKLYEKTRQQVEQLRKLNQEREEFLSTVSHELLTPLTSMTLAIRMLRQAELGVDRRLRYLEILEKQCVQETNLINDLLALRQLEMNPAALQVHKLDLHHLVEESVQSLESTWREKELRVEIELPSRGTFYSDCDSLNRILRELLTNAKKYSDPGSTIYLKATYQSELHARQLVLTVTNTGAGIAPDELPFIFDKFRRGRGVTQQAIQGTGLGLALVKSLVEHLEGEITATSRPLAHSTAWETCFTLTLPQGAEDRLHATMSR